MGVYTTSGKINTTTIANNVATFQGVSAADGGINVVLDSSGNGIYHKSGALRVNSGSGTSYYDSTGAVYSNHLMGPGR